MADQTVTLEQLKQALAQPNAAIRKRALAIIFNDVKIEAAPLLEEYLGKESDPALQGLTIKVLEKLKAFRESAGQVPMERLTPLLQNPDPQARLLALRAIATRQAPQLAETVLRHCAGDTSPEARALVAKILRNNPHPAAAPLLLALAESDVESVRQDAIEGLLGLINQCLLPEILKTLLDPSPSLKMRAYQLISNISRANLIDSLGALLASPDPEKSRLGGKLLPSFMNPDLIPLLSRNAAHRDEETAALCRRTILLLAQKGHFEAVQLLEKLSREASAAKGAAATASQATAKPTPAPAAAPPPSLPGNTLAKLAGLFAGYPEFLQKPLQGMTPAESPAQVILRLKECYARIRDLLAGPLLTAYFTRGRRSAHLDRVAFRALQQRISQIDLLALLRSLAPAFDLTREGELYPISIASRSQNSFGDHIMESMRVLQDIFQTLDSQAGDPGKYTSKTIEFMEDLVSSLAPVKANKLAIKCGDTSGIKVFDFFQSPPAPIENRLLMNFDLPMHAPLLISGDSVTAMNLAPFLTYDSAARFITSNSPGEHEIWEYLINLGILDPFLLFIKEKPV
ncbi:MAG TPA: HEAT repeat domain-containing protein [Candidatus Ozemobacteraceae bacterium]|nr:HEAT repeat domain-containing protein [Candidatus Ozemobacteraceae bacterium]